MLGYKFTIIKTQIAYIKQIIYFYLFNAFMVSPHSFYTGILFNFRKDSLNKNSKEQYYKFVKIISEIQENFYIQLDKVNPKIKKYMYLAAILNKDPSASFDNFSNQQILEIGSIELTNLFIETFLEFLDKIKEIYNIDIESLYGDISSEKSITVGDAAAIKNSLEDILRAAGFVSTLNQFNDYYLIPYFNFTSKEISDLTSSNVPADFDEKLKKLIFKNYSNGVAGEFYYKIKDKLKVNLDCGMEAKKNILAISYRSKKQYANPSAINIEFLCVQKFYNFENDESYKNLEQFIFYREPNIKEIIKYDDENSGLVIKKIAFDSDKYYGFKILNKQDILELKDKLIKSGDKSGFIAIIPVDTIKSEMVEKFNSKISTIENDEGIYITVFSEEERKAKMSIDDASKVLSYNDFFDKSNNFEINSKEANSQVEILRTLCLTPFLSSTFDVNKLFDVYFQVSINQYNIIKKPKTNNGLFSDTNVKNILQYLGTDILNKNGNFILLTPEITKNYSKKYNSEINTKIITLNSKTIASVRLNEEEDKIFENISTYEITEKTENLFIIPNKVKVEPKINEIKFLSNKYSEKLFQLLDEEKFKNIVNNLFPDSALSTNTTDISDKLDIDPAEINFDSITGLRSYKNFKDFINYYKDMVEGLAKEAQDRV